MPHYGIALPKYPAMLETKHLLVSDTVVGIAAFGFSAETLENANRLSISIVTASSNVTWDGTTDPTIVIGLIWKSNTNRVLIGNRNINNLQLIRQTATDSDITLVAERV